ncbi:MAG: amidohydrolase family protein, partial [Bacteroidales bacterium]|nr:amidohydrolase family protein [Bacteroidales bacterium]
KIKINAFLNDDSATLDYFLPKGIIVKERLSVRTVKLYADGALGSRGANLIEPYSDDPANRGLMINTLEYLENVCRRAYDAGYQVGTHAIGDAGVRNVLKVYAKFLKGHNDLRWRIEHSQVVDSNDIALFGEYSVIPSIQSTHATSDMGWAADRLGKDRVRYAYAQQMLLQQNGWLVNGTDFPIESIKPLYTFFAAVARKDLNGNPAEGFQMENALTREQALRSITIWAAKGYFEEKNKGSIEAGKEADFVVLDSDIMTISEMQIPQTAVLQLFVSGERVF